MNNAKYDRGIHLLVSLYVRVYVCVWTHVSVCVYVIMGTVWQLVFLVWFLISSKFSKCLVQIVADCFVFFFLMEETVCKKHLLFIL